MGFISHLSSRLKILLLVLVILVLAGGVLWFLWREKFGASADFCALYIGGPCSGPPPGSVAPPPSICSTDTYFPSFVNTKFSQLGTTPPSNTTNWQQAWDQFTVNIRGHAQYGMAVPADLVTKVNNGQILTESDAKRVMEYNLRLDAKPVFDYLKTVIAPQGTSLQSTVNNFAYAKRIASYGNDPYVSGFDTTKNLSSRSFRVDASLSGTSIRSIRATIDVGSTAQVKKTLVAKYSKCANTSTVSATEDDNLSIAGYYKIYQGTTLIANYNLTYGLNDGGIWFGASRSF